MVTRNTVANHWFVSVETPKRSAQTSARRTEIFPTETDAKQYAKAMLSEKHHMEKHRIVAGTLLGYLPGRRIISGAQLYSWVGALEPSLFKVRSRSNRRKPTDPVTAK
jgi:hypothetical protein